jgi:hypothetical protein
VCASLTEDRYGVVQRDIPRILEAFVSFLTTIEGYQAEILAAMPLTSAPATSADERLVHRRKEDELHKAFEVLAVADDGELFVILVVRAEADATQRSRMVSCASSRRLAIACLRSSSRHRRRRN